MPLEMRIRMPPMPLLIRAVIRNRDRNRHLLDRHLIHNTVLGVRARRDDLSRGGVVHIDRLGGGRNDRLRRVHWRRHRHRRRLTLNIVLTNPTRPLRACGRIALRGDGGDGRDFGLGGWFVAGAWLERVGVLGAVLDGDVSTQALRRAGAVVCAQGFGQVLDFAGCLFGLGLQAGGEDGAVFDAAGRVGAGCDGRLEGGDVPAVDEVGVVAVACAGVSKGEGIWGREGDGRYRLGRRWTRRIGRPCP